jgi:hypothetical protein
VPRTRIPSSAFSKESIMTRFHPLLITGVLTLGLGACAQVPEGEHSTHHPSEQTAATASAPIAGQPDMAAHMKAMQDLRTRMAQARTPEERRALMEEHMKLMREGMGMMRGMGAGGMGMMGRGGGTSGPASGMPCQQMMEMHMEMMQSMMPMMEGMPKAPIR